MKKKLFWNTVSSLILEVVSMVCAFILPRLIITNFGSEYNGIVLSVTRFLSVVTLLRGGVGGVTRAALYKPLVENDTAKISGIIKATKNFMRKIAYIFAAALIVFALIYPLMVKEEFEWLFTFSLVLILGIGTFSQYFFGIAYQMLLHADQRLYVYSIIQIVATILNTVLSVLFIRAGIEFRLVKLTSSIMFGVIPIALYIYVRRKYNIDHAVPADSVALKQRWDAFAHQVAAFVQSNTAVVILTFFSDLYQISVYSVYFMVANGVKKIVAMFASSVEAALGNVMARGNQKMLINRFEMYEWVMNVLASVAFCSTAVLIVPFISVYTAGVKDVNYILPILGVLMSVEQWLACIYLPYQNIIEAAGRFKETKKMAMIEALINIVASIVLVLWIGFSGVVVGAICAMMYRTILYAVYASKTILHRDIELFIKRMMVNIGVVLLTILAYRGLGWEHRMLTIHTYTEWIMAAMQVALVILLITVVFNVAFYRKISVTIIKIIVRKSAIKKHD